MPNWSATKYKMTLGVGTLGMAAIMGELWKSILPVWWALVIALLPILVFVFIHPGELNARLVRYAQMAASIWYLIVAVVLLAALLMSAKLPEGWLIFQVFVVIGSIPCWLVLFGRRAG